MSRKIDRRVRGICARLAFRGYRVFLHSPPVFQVRAPGSGHMLHYHDYTLQDCDFIATQLGFFPDAEAIGKWDLKKWKNKRDGTKYGLAFVNNGDFELIYMDSWYEKYEKRRGYAK